MTRNSIRRGVSSGKGEGVTGGDPPQLASSVAAAMLAAAANLRGRQVDISVEIRRLVVVIAHLRIATKCQDRG